MIKMYGYIPAWGLPDVSPFVSKIDCYLRMMRLPYELVKTRTCFTAFARFSDRL